MTRYALLLLTPLAWAPPAAAQWRYVPSANGVGTAVTNASDGQLLAVMCFGKTWSVSAGTTDPETVALAEQMDALDILMPAPEDITIDGTIHLAYVAVRMVRDGGLLHIVYNAGPLVEMIKDGSTLQWAGDVNTQWDLRGARSVIEMVRCN